MTEYTVVASLLNLAYLILAIATIRAMLYWFDRSLGIEFKKDVWDIIAQNARALALYHGVRFLAVCVFAALLLR